MEIENEFAKVLNDIDSHRYLGRLLYISVSDRINIENRSRQRATLTSFYKNKSDPLDHHESLYLRLNYFDVRVGPTIRISHDRREFIDVISSDVLI